MKYLFGFCCLLLLGGAGCTSEQFQSNLGSTPKDVGSSPMEVVPSASNTTIDLSDQQLTDFPMYLLDRTDIEELDLSGNQLGGALPAEIRKLSRLRVLDASNNAFTGVPAEIGQLRKLEVLDFSNNQLTGLPYELGNLTSLQVLDLSGNAISEVDLDIIRKQLPEDTDIRL